MNVDSTSSLILPLSLGAVLSRFTCLPPEIPVTQTRCSCCTATQLRLRAALSSGLAPAATAVVAPDAAVEL
eukprot:3220491-Rhodomonas_salina.1